MNLLKKIMMLITSLYLINCHVNESENKDVYFLLKNDSESFDTINITLEVNKNQIFDSTLVYNGIPDDYYILKKNLQNGVYKLKVYDKNSSLKKDTVFIIHRNSKVYISFQGFYPNSKEISLLKEYHKKLMIQKPFSLRDYIREKEFIIFYDTTANIHN